MATEPSPPQPDAVCDGGDLDCGSGLLLIIRRSFEPVPPGGILEVRSREASVREDLPAWCRMVGHTIVATEPGANRSTSYFLRKKGADAELAGDLSTAREFEWRTRVRWTGGMQATAYVRNHSFVVGQPASFDVDDLAPAAIEYLLGAIAGCLAVGFAWRASRAGVEIRNLELSLRCRAENILVFLGVADDGHPGVQRFEGRLFVDADADRDQLESIWRDTLERSPAAQTALRGVPVDVDLKIV